MKNKGYELDQIDCIKLTDEHVYLGSNSNSTVVIHIRLKDLFRKNIVKVIGKNDENILSDSVEKHQTDEYCTLILSILNYARKCLSTANLQKLINNLTHWIDQCKRELNKRQPRG